MVPQKIFFGTEALLKDSGSESGVCSMSWVPAKVLGGPEHYYYSFLLILFASHTMIMHCKAYRYLVMDFIHFLH